MYSEPNRMCNSAESPSSRILNAVAYFHLCAAHAHRASVYAQPQQNRTRSARVIQCSGLEIRVISKSGNITLDTILVLWFHCRDFEYHRWFFVFEFSTFLSLFVGLFISPDLTPLRSRRWAIWVMFILQRCIIIQYWPPLNKNTTHSPNLFIFSCRAHKKTMQSVAINWQIGARIN